MARFTLVLLAVTTLLSACASTHEPKKCPLGGITYISASGTDARDLAYDMAARDTLKDGFDKFTVLSHQENDGSYKMTVHMLYSHENDPNFQAIDARSLFKPQIAMTSEM